MREPTEWRACDCPCDCDDLVRLDSLGNIEYAKEYMARLEKRVDFLEERLGMTWQRFDSFRIPECARTHKCVPSQYNCSRCGVRL